MFRSHLSLVYEKFFRSRLCPGGESACMSSVGRVRVIISTSAVGLVECVIWIEHRRFYLSAVPHKKQYFGVLANVDGGGIVIPRS